MFQNYDGKQLENRSEIQALSMNLKSIRELEKSANAGYYPKINVSVSHNEYYDGLQMIDHKIKKIIKILQK